MTNFEPKSKVYWFVGATFGKKGDQTERFLKEGIWQTDNPERHAEMIRSMKPGDRIAIKKTYTRKDNLPFDNKGRPVSVMEIKAIGTILDNLGDGRTIKVDWKPLNPPRDWYFYTYIKTIWRVVPGDWASDALIQFAFENKPQDYNIFLNHPFWKERYSGELPKESRFTWTSIYEEIANKLLTFKNNRAPLVEALHDISKRVNGLTPLTDQYADGTSGPLKDICPFTVFGTFNRGITESNRKKIIEEIASFLDVNASNLKDFNGIPVLNNQKSWFFTYHKEREPDAIDVLWEVFELALKLPETDEAKITDDFVRLFDKAQRYKGVAWNLTTGLYWIRPWYFPTLDSQSRKYISEKLGISIPSGGYGKRCSGSEYLELREKLEKRFYEENFPVHSFPELSLEAWLYKSPGDEKNQKGAVVEAENDEEFEGKIVPSEPYTVDNIMNEGCFFEPLFLKDLLERLRLKKNLILQGPPGTGKTWLSKRLAFALIGQRDESKVRAVQFHPNLSYEDFVRGWRPSGDGKLTLMDGPFMEMVNVAKENPDSVFVMIIEEINRGNPAQIFGEMLTLLEADKRTPTAALELSYRRKDFEPVYVPDNLYVIGTMNIADRSLALVDFALRRRFAFVTLEPTFGNRWLEWVHKNFELSIEFLREIEYRILKLNEKISNDSQLGPQFKIGHSFLTPARGNKIKNPQKWFRQVVETEIRPLLEEYWFDDIEKAQKAAEELLNGI